MSSFHIRIMQIRRCFIAVGRPNLLQCAGTTKSSSFVRHWDKLPISFSTNLFQTDNNFFLDITFYGPLLPDTNKWMKKEWYCVCTGNTFKHSSLRLHPQFDWNDFFCKTDPHFKSYPSWKKLLPVFVSDLTIFSTFLTWWLRW